MNPKTIVRWAFVCLLLTTSSAYAQPRTLPPADYSQYCGICHGDYGKGDGLIAKALKTQPTDLTVLSKNNDGKFPLNYVKRVIDGSLDDRTISRVHGPEEMPVWRRYFAELSGSQAVGDARIKVIIEYVKSIQQ